MRLTVCCCSPFKIEDDEGEIVVGLVELLVFGCAERRSFVVTPSLLIDLDQRKDLSKEKQLNTFVEQDDRKKERKKKTNSLRQHRFVC